MPQAEPSNGPDIIMPTDTKRHASCDECRARKLKCSGEATWCSRCLREQITCHYSEQKRMGRPRKRRRNIDGDSNDDTLTSLVDDISQQDHGILDIPFEEIFQEGHPAGADSQELTNVPFLDPFFEDLTTTNATGFDGAVGVQDNNYHNTHDHSSNASNVPCACLDTLYLTLSSLQPYAASSTALVFPMPLLPMRKAISTGYTVLQCPQCPSVFASGMQNLMLLGTLLQLLAVCYSNMLHSIDSEAAALSAEGAKKKFRMGDMSEGTIAMHTGTPDCPMAFEVDLSANEWRVMARKVVINNVRGLDGKGGLMGLLNSMEERQRERHQSQPRHNHGNDVGCKLMSQATPPDGDYTCLRIMDHARKIIEAVDIN